jgi:arabinogalactan endo-1,4-beta-galactosidase
VELLYGVIGHAAGSRAPRLLLLLVLATAAYTTGGECGQARFMKGADISFLEEVEEGGGVYTEGGMVADPLDIFDGHGLNCIRLRVWVDPAGGYCDLESTLRMAARVKARGMGLLIDLHYSDTWADPGHQTMPAAWSGAAGDALLDSVRDYTGSVVAALIARGTPPDVVQIGNEVTCGMLWDYGRVCSPYDTPGQWEAFAGLTEAGVLGVRDAAGPADSIKVLVHIDRGGDNGGSRWFLDNLFARGVDFDLIGLSFYPWWHGTLADLEANLADLSGRYGKGLVIVETAYPWTLGWNDDTHNIVGMPEHLLPGYPATVEGQRAFLEDLMSTVAEVPDSRGLGVFYWAPEWVAAPSFGSAWENLALFDFSGEVLGSIDAFDSTHADVD